MTPTDPAVAAAEEARRRTGRVVERTLTPAPSRVDLGGRVVDTWSYDGSLPGKPIEVTAGDELSVRLVNGLAEPTSVHWHGVALRNDMDGVPDLTQRATAPGAEFAYDFVVPDPGTYWFHPHVGVQLDTGLYAPLVVADPAEPGKYDEEVVLVLDDWTDGWGTPPAELLAAFRRNGMGMGDMSGMDGMEMGMPSADEPLGADTGDVSYPTHLINGRVPSEPVTVTSSPNRRIRFRIVNAASDTAYRFAIGGHRLTVTHTDGFPVVPTVVDALIVGMGERARIRMGNLSMWNHPIHLHSNPFWVTGSDGGRWPQAQWRRETTEIIGVGQLRDIEFVPTEPGDWAFHCHMAHHTMGPMGHAIPNPTGVDQSGAEAEVRKFLPGYGAMGQFGMAEHSGHVAMGLQGPDNTLPMMTGEGQFGPIEMGGMFTVVKVRDDLKAGDYTDPGWYRYPKDKIARKVSADPSFGDPPRRNPYGKSTTGPLARPVMPKGESMPGMDHSKQGK